MSVDFHGLSQQAKYRCHGHSGIYQQRLACGHDIAEEIYKRNNFVMMIQSFQNPLLNINNVYIFFFQLFVIGILSPYLHGRLDDNVWAKVRELRDAAEICQRLHSMMDEYSIFEDGMETKIYERGDFRDLNPSD